MTIDLGSEGRERPAMREAASTQRRLVAIVSADMVGYSRLMGADKTGTLATTRAHRDELRKSSFEEIFNSLGYSRKWKPCAPDGEFIPETRHSNR